MLGILPVSLLFSQFNTENKNIYYLYGSLIGLFTVSLNLSIWCENINISLWLVWLVYIILPIMVLQGSLEVKTDLLVIICWLSIVTFLTEDILVFYIFYEFLIIPMIFLIGYFGSRNMKIRAISELVIYTISGSLLLLIGLLYLIISTGSTDMNILGSNLVLSANEQYFIFLFIFLGFSIKIPIIPVHIWLPKAHVEAPTSVSIFLAAILLKIGMYGYIRFLLPVAPLGIAYWYTIITTVAIIGIIYTSIIC